MAAIDASWQAGLLEPFEHDLLAGALELGSRPAAAVMIPRSHVVTVNRRMTLAEVERVIVESGHSRLPVAAVGSNDLLGVLLAKDLLRLPVEAQGEPVPLEVIRQMLVVPADLPLEDVLLRMRVERNHLAVVCGTGDHTLGVLTMEDVLEELVGRTHLGHGHHPIDDRAHLPPSNQVKDTREGRPWPHGRAEYREVFDEEVGQQEGDLRSCRGAAGD